MNELWRRGSVRRLAGAVAVLALVAAACGDDDDAAANGDTAAFCEQIVASEPSEGEVDAATYESLAAVAPGDLRADLARMAEWFAEIEALDERDAFDAAIALVADPEYQATVERLEGFLVDECGIEAEELTDVTPGAIEAAPGLDDDLDRAWQAALAEQFGERVKGAGRIMEGEYYAFDANIEELTPEEALAACAELSRILAGHPTAAAEASLLLTDHSFERANVELARNERITPGDPGTCEAV